MSSTGEPRIKTFDYPAKEVPTPDFNAALETDYYRGFGVSPKIKELKEELDVVTREFSPSELYVVLFVAKRLQGGRRKYGVLNPMDGRNWLIELAEEMADGLAYIASRDMEENGVG